MPPSRQASSLSRRHRRQGPAVSVLCSLLLLSFLPTSDAVHHMKRSPSPWIYRRYETRPLKITNNCQETIYPACQTQHGTGPDTTGFMLSPGDSKSQSVSADWQGRVWGRTNCTFNGDGTSAASGTGPACLTGDCGGTVACMGSVSTLMMSRRSPGLTAY
jgi:beta-mannosidase